MKISPTGKVVLASFLVNIIVIIFVIIFINNLPPQVPLFYGLPVSERQLARSSNLILPPLLAISFGLINLAASNILRDNFLQKITLGLTTATTILSTITVVKIILLVGSF